MSDSSFRFLHYLLKKLPKSYSYIVPKDIFPKASTVFEHICISDVEYEKKISKKLVGNDVPLAVDLNWTRKIMPPTWKEKNIIEIKTAYADPNIDYMLFPVLLVSSDKCKNGLDNNRHMVIILLNKKKNILELIDDRFGKNQTLYQYKIFFQDLIKEIMIPILATMLINVKIITRPTLKQGEYRRYERLLQKNRMPTSFGSIYAAFIANYVVKLANSEIVTQTQQTQETQKYKNKSLRDGELLNNYFDLLEFNKEYLSGIMAKCKKPKIYNLSSGKCEVSEYSKKESSMNPFNSKSKNQSLIDNPMYKYIYIPQYQSETTKYIPKHIESINGFYWLMSYIINEYKYTALIAPYDKDILDDDYSFQWDWSKENNKWELTPPENLEDEMNELLHNRPDIRFIIIYVGITDKEDKDTTHANCIIIDKLTNTAERFEPNTLPNINLGNDYVLDGEFAKVFEEYDLDFIPALDTCPLYFHHAEWEEFTDNVQDFGGNCSLWVVWYIHLRISNPGVPQKDVIQLAHKYVTGTESMKQFITGYHQYLHEIVNQIKY